MGNELKLLVLLSSLLIATGPAWANWCTVTHIKFNKEYTKMEVEGEPFKIGKLDSSGHTMALVIDGRTSSYKFLREVTVDGLRFREFRNESMVFQLGTPKKKRFHVVLKIYEGFGRY